MGYLIKDLPTGLKELAIERAREYAKKNNSKVVIKDLSGSFVLAETLEGHRFWAYLHHYGGNNLENMPEELKKFLPKMKQFNYEIY